MRLSLCLCSVRSFLMAQRRLILPHSLLALSTNAHRQILYNVVIVSDIAMIARGDEQSSAEKSRLRSEKPDRRRGTEQQEHSRAGAQKNRSMRRGERGHKKQRKIERPVKISKMRRSQQQRNGEIRSKVRLASYEPNMRLLAF